MLKGHVFNLQTFTSDAFALFIDRFLNKRCGVAKGCELSNTNTSATIGDGYFVVRGRFLQIISGVTVDNISNNGYYSLVCEIDLSKTNTTSELNQAVIKTLYNASAYPTLTQEDITGDGTIYQYEFAKIQVVNGAISTFTDTRTFVNFESIYDEIETESDAVLEDIRQALADIEDLSNVSLKSDFAVLTGTMTLEGSPTGNPKESTLNLDFPAGFDKDNCICIAFGMKTYTNRNYSYGVSGTESSKNLTGAFDRFVILGASSDDTKISLKVYQSLSSTDFTAYYKVVLMKIS